MSQASEKTYLFESAPIHQAVWTMALPTVVTQLINIVYNYADTWYVGRTANADMVATLGVCFPIFVIMAAVANLFGVGGSSMISRSLGEKKTDKARHVFAFAFWFGMLAAVVYMLIMIFFREQIIYLVGGDDSTFHYVSKYIFWTMIIGAIPSVGNVLCGHLVRSIGASKEAGIGMSMGGILNMILDPLFMFVILPKGHEIEGAAIATMLSNTIAFLYFLVYIVRYDKASKGEGVVTLHPRDISFEEGIVGDVLMIGLPAALQTTFAMVSNIFANVLIRPYGSTAVAGMGVAKKINMIAFNTCMGMTMGILPLLGYCYGAKNLDRMKRIIRYTGTVIVIFGCICTVMFRTFADDIIRFFINEPGSVNYGTQFLKIIAFAAPLAALSYLVNTLFQATGRKKSSFVFSIMRKGILDIPAMFVFRSVVGAVGVCLATPFAEVTSVVIAVVLYRRLTRHLQIEMAATR